MANIIKINNIVLTDLFPKYAVRFAKIRGSHARYSIGGSYKDDVRASLAVVSFPAVGVLQSSSDLSTLADLAAQTGEVTLYYFDPRSTAEGGGYRTIRAIMDEPTFEQTGEATGGTVWTISSFTLTEVT